MLRYFLPLILFSCIALADVINSSVNLPTFPPAGLTLLQTVTTSYNRVNITVVNESANDIQIWRDTDCAGTQRSMIVLQAGSGAGKLGSVWSSQSFKNCIKVYGIAGSQVSIYQD